MPKLLVGPSLPNLDEAEPVKKAHYLEWLENR